MPIATEAFEVRFVYSSADWRWAKQRVLMRDGYQCSAKDKDGQRCPKVSDLSVHHVVPLTDNGAPFDLGNLVTLCQKHHRQAQRRTAWSGLPTRIDPFNQHDWSALQKALAEADIPLSAWLSAVVRENLRAGGYYAEEAFNA